MTEPIEDDDNDNDDGRHMTEWVILVNPKTGAWVITQVSPGLEVGELDGDLTYHYDGYMIGSAFDENVKKILDAITHIGGDSLEVRQVIEDLLMGTCRSFVEAQKNLKKWKTKPPSS